MKNIKNWAGVILPKDINSDTWIKGIEIKSNNETVLYFDKKNKQLIIQSPPLMGKIFYIPFKKINFL
jgi:hypothetical protein